MDELFCDRCHRPIGKWGTADVIDGEAGYPKCARHWGQEIELFTDRWPDAILSPDHLRALLLWMRWRYGHVLLAATPS